MMVIPGRSHSFSASAASFCPGTDGGDKVGLVVEPLEIHILRKENIGGRAKMMVNHGQSWLV